MKLIRPLRGIIPPVLTPLANLDQLDASAFDQLLNYLIEGFQRPLRPREYR